MRKVSGIDFLCVHRAFAGEIIINMNLPNFENARVLVVGDIMLDRYWFGEVSRISPEAPVPVVHVSRTEERPGGAANVARNAAALGARVSLLSVAGKDEAGDSLARLLHNENVNVVLHRDAGLDTTIKLRVIGRQQQLLRIDFETTPSHEVLLSKLADFENMLADADVVILSDYGKGGLTHIRADDRAGQRACRQAGAGRSQGRRLRALPRRHPADAQSRRIPRGGGELEKRGRTGEESAAAAPRPRLAGAAGHPQRRGHDALPRSGHGARTCPGA